MILLKRGSKHTRNGERICWQILNTEQSTKKRLPKRNYGCSWLRRAKKQVSHRWNLPDGLAFHRRKWHAWRNVATMRIPSIAYAGMCKHWARDFRLILLCAGIGLRIILHRWL